MSVAAFQCLRCGEVRAAQRDGADRFKALGVSCPRCWGRMAEVQRPALEAAMAVDGWGAVLDLVDAENRGRRRR